MPAPAGPHTCAHTPPTAQPLLSLLSRASFRRPAPTGAPAMPTPGSMGAQTRIPEGTVYSRGGATGEAEADEELERLTAIEARRHGHYDAAVRQDPALAPVRDPRCASC